MPRRDESGLLMSVPPDTGSHVSHSGGANDTRVPSKALDMQSETPLDLHPFNFSFKTKHKKERSTRFVTGDRRNSRRARVEEPGAGTTSNYLKA